MNGYKTGGDWTDVTSIVRNEVVFDGRHKAYGAYYIRQRYPSSLLFALLSAIAFVALPVLIAYAVRNVSQSVAAAKTDLVIKPTDVLVHRQIITPPVTHLQVQPPRITPNRFMPPVITQQPLDSIPFVKPNDHPTLPIAGMPGTGTETVAINPPSDPGTIIPVIEDNKIRTWVNQMPKFPGGDINKYLASHISYPAEEAQLGVQGIVYASFIVEKDGSVSNVKLEQGIPNGPDLNREALRVLSEMPAWSPGKQDGHPVRIQYSIPIHFKLQ